MHRENKENEQDRKFVHFSSHQTFLSFSSKFQEQIPCLYRFYFIYLWLENINKRDVNWATTVEGEICPFGIQISTVSK